MICKIVCITTPKQIALGNEQHALVNDVVTKLNSIMVTRVLKQQQPLCDTLLELKKGDLMPKESDCIAECLKA